MTENGTSGGDSPAPAYTPFATFKSFTGNMKEGGLPPQIDKSLMGTYSGSAQSVLLSSLRSLGLIDEVGSVLPLFRRLVDAHGTDEWPAAVGEMVDAAYADILADLDLKVASKQMLEARFSGIGASIRQKAIRFLLMALNEEGREVSKYLTMKGRNGSSGAAPGKRRRRRSSSASTGTPFVEDERLPDKGKKFTFPLRPNFEAVLMLPDDLTKADVERLHQFLAIIPFDE